MGKLPLNFAALFVNPKTYIYVPCDVNWLDTAFPVTRRHGWGLRYRKMSTWSQPIPKRAAFRFKTRDAFIAAISAYLRGFPHGYHASAEDNGVIVPGDAAEWLSAQLSAEGIEYEKAPVLTFEDLPLDQANGLIRTRKQVRHRGSWSG
jgi:hypothetical protein